MFQNGKPESVPQGLVSPRFSDTRQSRARGEAGAGHCFPANDTAEQTAMLQKRDRFRAPTLHEAAMISQDMEGGEMRLIKCMA